MTDAGLGPGVKKAGYHLQLFGVHPDYQKQGIGSAMDKAVENSVCPCVMSLKSIDLNIPR